MKITEMLRDNKVTLSFEVFPPKVDSKFDTVAKACKELAGLAPDFMSVTYGAGGGTSAYTADIAEMLNGLGIPSVAHLTCVNSSLSHVDGVLDTLKAKKIENVLALRGDRLPEATESAFRYAYQLISYIKRKAPSLCIGAACYPEGHIEAESRDADMIHLCEKVKSGADFLTTQMFFDNDVFYGFMYRALKAGIDVPVIPAIMPILNANQIERSCAMSGAHLPPKLRVIIDKFADKPEAMRQAGIVYACEQITDLVANGMTAIHIYTMNKPSTAKSILENISSILER